MVSPQDLHSFDSSGPSAGLVDLAPVALISLDPSGRLTWCDNDWLRLTGRAAADLRGHGWLSAIDERDRHALASRMQHALEAREELEIQARIGIEPNERWVLFRWRPRWIGDHFAGMVGSGTDITDERTTRAELAYRATTDSLTGLPNRLLFLEHLKNELGFGERWPDRRLAVAYCDLDHFAGVNAAHGQARADDLLAAVGRRLSESVRPFDVVSRIDGDEFAILLRCLDDVEDATAAMTRILNELALPYRLDSRSLEVTTSIGVALPRSPREHPESIIQRAEMAMHRAKSLGRCRIELALQQTDIDLTATTPDLDVRAGIAGDQFRPWYQPIVDLDTGGVVACEALLRWMHPSFGALAAGEFIELATTEGVLVPLANRAIRHALDEAAGHPDLELFVNLSPHQLQGDIGADMLSWCNAAGLAPTRLVVEITESTIVTEPEAAREQLLVLHDAGVRIAIDDFGSGYSSFSRMRLFPISILKIDAALITDIDIDDRCRRLVDGIVKLADGLGVAVVAEGVEADAEVEVLKALGVRLAQGYQFGAAVPTPGATDALTLLS